MKEESRSLRSACVQGEVNEQYFDLERYSEQCSNPGRISKAKFQPDIRRRTRLTASRSSSICPEGCFSFFHRKVKV